MSEQEFENWLALLAGLLKLSPEQRNNISDELRSHLEERMEDLIDAGSSREAAIAAALEEFGDTAALAHHFTSIAHQKRRRLMRYTYGTIAAVTCSLLVISAFWQGSNTQLTPRGIAQTEPGEGAGTTDSAAAPDFSNPGLAGRPADPSKEGSEEVFAESRARIEAKLSEPLSEIGYFQMPLREVIHDLSKTIGVTVFFDPSLLGDVIDPDLPIDVQAPENTMSAKTLLNDFILKPNFGEEVGYTIRDNYLFITAKYETTEIAVYNCRDLLRPTAPSASMGGMMSGDGGMEDFGQMSGMGSAEMYGGDGLGMPAPSNVDQHLMRVITTTISPDTWIIAGKVRQMPIPAGSIDAINGVIVIKHTREVHEKVQELLKLLREVENSAPGGGGQGVF